VGHKLGVVPAAVVVSANTPAGWNGFMLNTVRDSFTATTFQVRAMSTASQPKNGGTIWFSYIAYPPQAAPPTTTVPPTTTAPPITTNTSVPPTTTTPPAPPSGFPTAATTGVPAGTVFAWTLGYYEARTAGEVLDGVHSTSAILVTAPNVVIKNSQIDDTVVVQGNGSLTITDSVIGPPNCGAHTWYAAGLGFGHYTALRVHIRGHEDGFNAGAPDIEIRDSYVDICTAGSDGPHADGIQDYPRADGLIFDHNTVDLRGEAGMNAAVFVNAGDQGQPVSNDVTISNNLLMGGGYVLRIWPGTGTWNVVGNRVVNGTWAYSAYTASGRCSLVDRWEDNDVVSIDGGYGVTATVQDNVSC
jgi:hypothetical protein